MVLQCKVGALPHGRRTRASRVRTGSGQPACVHALGCESSGVVRPPRSFQFERRRTPGNGFLSVVQSVLFVSRAVADAQSQPSEKDKFVSSAQYRHTRNDTIG